MDSENWKNVEIIITWQLLIIVQKKLQFTWALNGENGNMHCANVE